MKGKFRKLEYQRLPKTTRMKNNKKAIDYLRCLLVFFLNLLCLSSFTQVPRFAQVPILRPGDSANISR